MLTRFRADPSKVRVSIRKWGDGWFARVCSKADPTCAATATSNDPKDAVDRALKLAERLVKGVDLDMGQTYLHPMRGQEDV